MLPPGSLAAQCLAVERYEEAKQLHAKALRAQKPESWHALRIGLKKLRYTAESLLPQQSEQWSENLKKLQDILGEVHDLDVLSGIIKKETSGEADAYLPEWERTIARERHARLGEYRELAVGTIACSSDRAFASHCPGNRRASPPRSACITSGRRPV